MTDPTNQFDETNFDYLLAQKCLIEPKSNFFPKVDSLISIISGHNKSKIKAKSFLKVLAIIHKCPQLLLFN